MDKCKCCVDCEKNMASIEQLISGMILMVKNEIKMGFLEMLREIQLLENLKTQKPEGEEN